MKTTLNWCRICQDFWPEDYSHCSENHRTVLQEFECTPITPIEKALQALEEIKAFLDIINVEHDYHFQAIAEWGMGTRIEHPAPLWKDGEFDQWVKNREQQERWNASPCDFCGE